MEGNGIRCYGNRIYRNQLLPVTDGIFPLRQNRTAHSNIRDKRAVCGDHVIVQDLYGRILYPLGKRTVHDFCKKIRTGIRQGNYGRYRKYACGKRIFRQGELRKIWNSDFNGNPEGVDGSYKPEKEGFSQAPVPTDRVYRQQKQQQKQQQKWMQKTGRCRQYANRNEAEHGKCRQCADRNGVECRKCRHFSTK